MRKITHLYKLSLDNLYGVYLLGIDSLGEENNNLHSHCIWYRRSQF